MHQLWDDLHDMFDTDDGSLPDIYLVNLSGDSVARIWTHLLKSASDINRDASFWHRAKGKDIPVNDVPNAADLVVRGEAESFHVVVQGISLGETVIPDLGVFVFPDAIYFDYRMGPEWGVAELTSLFALLYQLRAMDQNAVVTLPPEYEAESRKRFAEAFAEYGRNAAEQALEADSH